MNSSRLFIAHPFSDLSQSRLSTSDVRLAQSPAVLLQAGKDHKPALWQCRIEEPKFRPSPLGTKLPDSATYVADVVAGERRARVFQHVDVRQAFVARLLAKAQEELPNV